MPKFCTQCGTSNENDARFCDNCGTALKTENAAIETSSTAEVNTAEVSVAQTKKRRKIAKLSVVLLAVALLGGLLGAFLLSDEPPSAETFKRAVNEHLKTHPNDVDNLVCLSNIDYSVSPVIIDRWDYTKKEWYDELVTAGIYATPTAVESGTGFYRKVNLQYAHTQDVHNYIKGKRLCISSGVAVLGVKTFPIFETSIGTRIYVKPDYQFLGSAFPLHGKLEAIAKEHLQKWNTIWKLVIVNHKWIVEDQSQAEKEKRKLRENAISARNSVFGKISTSFQSKNPLFGVWLSKDADNRDWASTNEKVQLTFNEHEFFLDTRGEEVTFEITGNFVLARIPNYSFELVGDHYVKKLRDDPIQTFTFRLIDADHIALATSKGERVFDRITK